MSPAIARKAVAAFISVFAILILRRFGMSPEDISTVYGVNVNEVQEWLVDAIMAGAPTLLVYYQPNQIGDKLQRYWKQLLIGFVILILLFVVVGIAL